MEQNNSVSSMHAQAKQNTEEALAYLFVQAHTKAEELNKLGETVMKHAQMELYVAQMENIAIEEMSSTAQRLHENPNTKIENRFKGQVFYLENGTRTQINEVINEENVFVVTPEQTEDEQNDESTNIDDIETESKSDDVEHVKKEVQMVIKSFDKLKPAYTNDVAHKIYKASVMKTARALILELIKEQTQIAMNNLVILNEDTAKADETANKRAVFARNSMISSMYDTVIAGAEACTFDCFALSDEAQKVQELDSLAYTIVSNAEEFREMNESVVGQKLTASKVKEYYKALGNFESTDEQKISGQEVIKNELANDVATIMSR